VKRSRRRRDGKSKRPNPTARPPHAHASARPNARAKNSPSPLRVSTHRDTSARSPGIASSLLSLSPPGCQRLASRRSDDWYGRRDASVLAFAGALPRSPWLRSSAPTSITRLLRTRTTRPLARDRRSCHASIRGKALATCRVLVSIPSNCHVGSSCATILSEAFEEVGS
jgi:hypothetical protein